MFRAHHVQPTAHASTSSWSDLSPTIGYHSPAVLTAALQCHANAHCNAIPLILPDCARFPFYACAHCQRVHSSTGKPFYAFLLRTKGTNAQNEPREEEAEKECCFYFYSKILSCQWNRDLLESNVRNGKKRTNPTATVEKSLYVGRLNRYFERTIHAHSPTEPRAGAVQDFNVFAVDVFVFEFRWELLKHIKADATTSNAFQCTQLIGCVYFHLSVACLSFRSNWPFSFSLILYNFLFRFPLKHFEWFVLCAVAVAQLPFNTECPLRVECIFIIFFQKAFFSYARPKIEGDIKPVSECTAYWACNCCCKQSFLSTTHTHRRKDEENIQFFFSPNNKNDGLEHESVVSNRIKAKSEGLNPKSKHLPSYFFALNRLERTKLWIRFASSWK